MALYEHVFISRQDLSNTQAEGLIEHFGGVLTDNGGKVVESEYWGLKTMAYKINKNRKGHYAFVRSDAPAPAVKEMERLMGERLAYSRCYSGQKHHDDRQLKREAEGDGREGDQVEGRPARARRRGGAV